MNASTSNQHIEKPLPHSPESEVAILGSILLDNTLISQAIEILVPEEFYVQSHRRIFKAMIDLFKRDKEINPILISEQLRLDGALESVGGITFISNLTHGLPHFTDISQYAQTLHDESVKRQFLKILNKTESETLEDSEEIEYLIERHYQECVELSQQLRLSERAPLMLPFAAFMRKKFSDGEQIAGHACRGEILQVQSVTNHGKSTLIRNAALTLATGGSFPPLVETGTPRKVLLLNFEGAAERFQSDLEVMTRDFVDKEFELLRENLFLSHSPLVRDDPLSLSLHIRVLEAQVRRVGIDVLIIDTASAAFSIRNENDNAEIANTVMKPLVGLARRLNCLVVLIHHIGKARLEEGATREDAHRGRGASAWADFPASIFNLEQDTQDKELVMLKCAKRKDGSEYEVAMRLSRDRRWFEQSTEARPEPVTNNELVLNAIRASGRSEMRTAEIEEMFSGKLSERTVRNCLNRLADQGKVVSKRRGWWALTELGQVVQTPYRDLHYLP